MNIKKVMVVGAGLMGQGIAQTCVESGFETLICDTSLELVLKGIQKTEYFLKRKVDKGKITEESAVYSLSLLKASENLEEGADADIVIEAVTENREIKKDVLSNIDRVVKPEAIIASNTSSFSISALAGYTNRPEKVIGMHFFVPAPVMKLVEVIPGLLTGKDTVDIVCKFAESLGKTYVIAPDTAGFIVNRLLVSMQNEAANLVAEGVSPEVIDTAMKLGANHPMGPLELTDFAGIDTVLSTMQEIFENTGDPKFRPSPLLKKMKAAGLLGRKSGRGFYTYNEAHAKDSGQKSNRQE